MLLVPATVGASKIHSLGLIAREFIPRGARVWELNPEFDVVLSRRQVRELAAPARKQLLWYAYFDPARQVYVLSADDDRFTNHSDTPNTSEDETGIASIATRDIHVGEEITWNYRKWRDPAGGGLGGCASFLEPASGDVSAIEARLLR